MTSSLVHNLLSFFNEHRLISSIPFVFKDRYARNAQISDLITSLKIHNVSILNVGSGGERHLQSCFSPNVRITDIDICGDCDYVLDLDAISSLPFNDNSFSVVTCLDVLEHLDQFHLIFHELIRCSSTYIVISLPNSNIEFFNSLFLRPYCGNHESAGLFSKFYGLPMQRPIDRHRWFISFFDIIHFIKKQSELYNFHTVNFAIPAKLNTFSRLAFALLPRFAHNFLVPYVVVIIQK
jgi:hypothetical protein